MPGGRGVNVLTSDGLADMGGGPAFHSTMVDVVLADPSEATFSGHAQHEVVEPNLTQGRLAWERRPRRLGPCHTTS